MPQRKVTIVNRRGLHARAAAKFVRVVEQFGNVDIRVSKDDMQVPGASIMGLLMLGACRGSEISISTAESDALDALTALVESGFGENE